MGVATLTLMGRELAALVVATLPVVAATWPAYSRGRIAVVETGATVVDAVFDPSVDDRVGEVSVPRRRVELHHSIGGGGVEGHVRVRPCVGVSGGGRVAGHGSVGAGVITGAGGDKEEDREGSERSRQDKG